MKGNRIYCPYCANKITHRKENGVERDYCPQCDKFFYDNPLPVASCIITDDRKLLLVKRKYAPRKGEWCLPTGFAESGESIENAALRELQEETGINGKVIDLIDINSARSNTYGDLIFITFEAEWVDGDLLPGDDAAEVRFFAL